MPEPVGPSIGKRPINKFIHIGVECYYQQNHILHIEEQKRNQINDNRTLFQYDMDHVKEIRVREIMRDKI